MKLLYNSIRCKQCGDVLVSFCRHDFKRCKCGQASIDGGLEYVRTSGVVKDLSVWDNGKHEVRRKYLHWGVNYSKDNVRYESTKWTSISTLGTDHIKAILDTVKTIDPFYKEVLTEELKRRTND